MKLPDTLLNRKKVSHKNNFGHGLLIAGSQRMIGAAVISTLATFRSGAGLVTLGVPSSLMKIAQAKIVPEVMMLPLGETDNECISADAFQEVSDMFSKFNVIGVGPGLGMHESTSKFVIKLVSQSILPLVIDADALNILSENLETLKMSNVPKVLTPHPGEMQRLLGRSRRLMDEERVGLTQNFACEHNCVVLLKGHNTVVSDPYGNIYINQTGNAGMATAGSGDVLTGIITGFMAQGLSAFEAAKYGAYIHGTAGDLAAREIGEVGLMASDLLKYLPVAMSSEKKI